MSDDGLQDAAILLMSLGEAEAAEVFKHLSPKEVQKLGEAIAKTKTITRERVDEVVERFTGIAAAHSLLVSDSGDVLAQASTPTGEGTRVEDLADSLASLRAELLAGAEAPPVAGRRVARQARPLPVGVGLAGALDRSGTLRGSPHLPLLVGTRIGAALKLAADSCDPQRTNRPILVLESRNLFGYGVCHARPRS